MSRHKDFDAARAERAREPLTFTLDGHVFTTVTEIPAAPLLALAAKLDDDIDDPNAATAAISAFTLFVRDVVREEDRERFGEALEHTDLETMAAIAAWVLEETTGRPLSPSSSSPPEQSTPGDGSRVVSLAPVSETRSA